MTELQDGDVIRVRVNWYGDTLDEDWIHFGKDGELKDYYKKSESLDLRVK